ncbi:hypothetical protein ABVT39_006984 [Epinephelus coioides]
MKTIQCLTVVVMMTVMVYTASLSKDELLKDICDAARNMSKMNTRNFFCLAEKSLDTKKHQLHGKLIGLLKQFNSKTECTQCQLNTTNEYELREFLNAVMECVDHRMTSSPSLKCQFE